MCRLNYTACLWSCPLPPLARAALATLLILALQVATNNCLLRTFDITTMKKEDATFEAPFSITASR